MDSVTETMRNCERLLQKHDPLVIGDNTKGLSASRVRELMMLHNIENAPVIRKSKNRRHTPLGDFTCKVKRQSRTVQKYISEMEVDKKTLILRSEYTIISRHEIVSGKSFRMDELTSMPEHYLITRIK